MALIYFFAGTFAPNISLQCLGQQVAISSNTALFALVGTFYGGNGTSTFGLPDLRGRGPIGTGTSTLGTTYTVGQMGGTETAAMTTNNMPMHTHVITLTPAAGGIAASAAAATSGVPGPSLVPAKLPTIGGGPTAQQIKGYAAPDGVTFLPAPAAPIATAALAGNSIPLPIMNPYVAFTAYIVTSGSFPSRN